MKLFIWEGEGISNAYHDDGTLVILANTVEEAREIMLASKAHFEYNAYNWTPEGIAKHEAEGHGKYCYSYDEGWDGTEEALNREPDRIIDTDKPVVVAFNGGGYD